MTSVIHSSSSRETERRVSTNIIDTGTVEDLCVTFRQTEGDPPVWPYPFHTTVSTSREQLLFPCLPLSPPCLCRNHYRCLPPIGVTTVVFRYSYSSPLQLPLSLVSPLSSIFPLIPSPPPLFCICSTSTHVYPTPTMPPTTIPVLLLLSSLPGLTNEPVYPFLLPFSTLNIYLPYFYSHLTLDSYNVTCTSSLSE